MRANNPDVLIEKAQQLLEMAMLLLAEAKHQNGFTFNRLISIQEENLLLKQGADHEYDGLSFADTLDGEQ